MMKRTAVLVTCLVSGCAPVVGGLGGAAVAFGPSVPGWINAATTGVKVLSATAKLACAVQADANAMKPPNVKLSTEAGKLCIW